MSFTLCDWASMASAPGWLSTWQVSAGCLRAFQIVSGYPMMTGQSVNPIHKNLEYTLSQATLCCLRQTDDSH